MSQTAKLKGGEACDFSTDDDILSINSPRGKVDGPYLVIHKNADQRYALVALDWDGEPRIGIRWFWESVGNPQSRSVPTWTILPDDLYRALQTHFPLNVRRAHYVDKFLAGEITGKQLKDSFK